MQFHLFIWALLPLPEDTDSKKKKKAKTDIKELTIYVLGDGVYKVLSASFGLNDNYQKFM